MTIVEEFKAKFSRHQKTYLMVIILLMLDYSLPEGKINFNDFIEFFKQYYRDRMEKGKISEANDSIMSKEKPSNPEIRSLLLGNPIPRLSDFIIHDKEKGILKFKENVLRELNKDTITQLRKTVFKHLYNYYKGLDSRQLTIMDLDDLPLEYAVSATDVSLLSKQNQVKGIHPIKRDEFKGVIILSTLGGGALS